MPRGKVRREFYSENNKPDASVAKEAGVKENILHIYNISGTLGIAMGFPNHKKEIMDSFP